MKRLVIATGNAGKLREIQALLAPVGIESIGQSAFSVSSVEETGATFIENAILKARHAAMLSGLPALADDSGLVVDALGGAPGIHSARYAGESANDAANVRKLLVALEGVPKAERTARFQCVLALLRHADDPVPLVCEGSWEGRIADAPSGADGFGYDPVFMVPTLGKTAAQMAPEQKNRMSHRGKALIALRTRLRERP